MSRVFDLLLDEKIVSAGAATAFARYTTDQAFQDRLEGRMPVQERVSLATMAGPLPQGMSHSAMVSMMYDMRHRFRAALERLMTEAA